MHCFSYSSHSWGLVHYLMLCSLVWQSPWRFPLHPRFSWWTSQGHCQHGYLTHRVTRVHISPARLAVKRANLTFTLCWRTLDDPMTRRSLKAFCCALGWFKSNRYFANQKYVLTFIMTILHKSVMINACLCLRGLMLDISAIIITGIGCLMLINVDSGLNSHSALNDISKRRECFL